MSDDLRPINPFALLAAYALAALPKRRDRASARHRHPDRKRRRRGAPADYLVPSQYLPDPAPLDPGDTSPADNTRKDDEPQCESPS